MLSGYKVIKRNTETNTHSNLVDDHILEVIPYRINKMKSFLFVILCLITIGIIYIFSKIFSKLYIKLNLERCDLGRADYFVIYDQNKDTFIVEAIQENYSAVHPDLRQFYTSVSLPNKVLLRDSHYTKSDLSGNTDSAIVIFD